MSFTEDDVGAFFCLILGALGLLGCALVGLGVAEGIQLVSR